MTEPVIRVAVVEDELRTREGLRTLIEQSGDFCCVGAWESVEQALAGVTDASGKRRV